MGLDITVKFIPDKQAYDSYESAWDEHNVSCDVTNLNCDVCEEYFKKKHTVAFSYADTPSVIHPDNEWTLGYFRSGVCGVNYVLFSLGIPTLHHIFRESLSSDFSFEDFLFKVNWASIKDETTKVINEFTEKINNIRIPLPTQFRGIDYTLQELYEFKVELEILVEAAKYYLTLPEDRIAYIWVEWA